MYIATNRVLPFSTELIHHTPPQNAQPFPRMHTKFRSSWYLHGIQDATSHTYLFSGVYRLLSRTLEEGYSLLQEKRTNAALDMT